MVGGKTNSSEISFPASLSVFCIISLMSNLGLYIMVRYLLRSFHLLLRDKRNVKFNWITQCQAFIILLIYTSDNYQKRRETNALFKILFIKLEATSCLNTCLRLQSWNETSTFKSSYWHGEDGQRLEEAFSNSQHQIFTDSFTLSPLYSRGTYIQTHLTWVFP